MSQVLIETTPPAMPPPALANEREILTEEDLQAAWADSDNKLVQLLLAARREVLATNGRFLTDEEILAEVRAGRGASAIEDD